MACLALVPVAVAPAVNVIPSGPVIYLPPPDIAGLLTASAGRVIEYANKRLANLSADAYRRFEQTLARFADAALCYLLDETGLTTFNQANINCYSTVKQIKAGRIGGQPAVTRPASAFRDPQVAARYASQQQQDDAAALKGLLHELLDIDAQPERELIEIGEFRYRLKHWYPRPGLIVDRRNPTGASFIAGTRIAFTRAEALTLIDDLAKIFEMRLKVFGRHLKDTSPPGHGPLFEQVNRIEDVDAAIQRMNQEAVANANRAARAAAASLHPPSPAPPSFPLLAGQSGD